MKFVELKKNLTQGLKNVYLLEGEDRYVLYNALNLIEKKLALSMPDVNKIVIEGEKASPQDILIHTESYPFGDEKKLIVVNDYTSKADFSALEKYLKQPNDFILLIFVSRAESEASKKIKHYAEFVDCSRLDDVTLSKWIVGAVSKSGLQIEEEAVKKLIVYCANNLAKISTELDKLMCVGEAIISAKLIEKFVTPDQEYQIYELTDNISKGNGVEVFNILKKLQEGERNNVGLIQYLYQAFKRLLLISLSKQNDIELGSQLGIKPYAVKMARIQASKFGAKKLKHINELLATLEHDIKTGKANQSVSVEYAICRILMERSL